MRLSYSRRLNTPEDVQEFLSNTLQYGDHKNIDTVVSKIVKGELGLPEINRISPTLHDSKFRNSSYKSDSSRWELRKQIVEELYTLERLNIDDKIQLTIGGAVPKAKMKCKGQAFIITGLPASGKSFISTQIAEQNGAIILDSDFAKRKLPEYNYYEFGGAIVHEESDSLIFGYNGSDKSDGFECLFDKCIKKLHNICIPKIGYDPNSLLKFIKELIDFQYDVHMILISLDRRKATIRAVNRYMETDRYVPLGLIFDGYANDPDNAYHTLLEHNKKNKIFKSMGQLSTDVDFGSPPKILHFLGKSPVLSIGIK